MKTQSASPLLELIEQRWREFVSGLPDPTADKPFKRPAGGGDWKSGLMQRARAHAESDHSDPFSGRRALHYMKQGYWLPSEVHEDARRSTQARRAAGATFPTVKV